MAVVTDAEIAKAEAQTRAYLDMADRVARNDPDWGYYEEGDPRPHFPWWRRLLKI
jgi:hypothetical protein